MNMPAFTIVTTSATQDSDAAEVNTLTDDFGAEAEALGYSRRMADEMLGLAAQLSLDFDYSNVALYDGDLLEEDLDRHSGRLRIAAVATISPSRAMVAAPEQSKGSSSTRLKYFSSRAGLSLAISHGPWSSCRTAARRFPHRSAAAPAGGGRPARWR
jgi:hypothetical protein